MLTSLGCLFEICGGDANREPTIRAYGTALGRLSQGNSFPYMTWLALVKLMAYLPLIFAL